MGKEHLSLRDCEITYGSVLTLHALGTSAEKKQIEHELKKKNETTENIKSTKKKVELITLSTSITAAKANHSYNGVIFDVACNGPYEIDLTSISIAGMLSRVV
jgi:hypothetical protein